MKPGSKGWKNFMAKLYGIGAAVVIIGALFKIEHLPGSSIMLFAGLGTEAVIFFFSAFEKPHEEPDWSLVYPELNASHDDVEELEEAINPKHNTRNNGRGGSVTEALDKMLDDAKIEPQLIENLGNGLRSLGEQAAKLNTIVDASVATNEYTSSLKGASEKVSELADTYQKASGTLVGLSDTSEYGKSAGEGLLRLTKNLNALNESYELQLRGATDQLKVANEAFSGVGELIRNLNDSVSDTKMYRDNIAELSKNLASLNAVYGNMLAAMTIKPGFQS
ncbi:MAG TPA: gliding motility protein GldL [Luteibaculaceae bacterium]|nr:gliding motility protein GldL [Luteibaculaceae bacterium]